jgi:glycosyltransferase involved in cell wall biosynthesis
MQQHSSDDVAWSPAPSPFDGTESRHADLLSRFRRVAIVHDWCPSYRGGERVLSELCRIFPGAEVFTLFDFLTPEEKAQHFPGVKFTVSPANGLPAVHKYYRHLFFLCPFLIEQFDVTGFDAVISSSAAFSRGIVTRPDQPHLCYVHSPVRYAWDEQFSYIAQGKLGYGPKGLLYRKFLHDLRIWDARTAFGPDLMLANSNFIRGRISRIYGRDADVVFPPVDVDEMTLNTERDENYVTASFLAPYKRTDLVIKAFNAMPHRKLLVVGEGQQSSALRSIAGPNVTFTGYLPREDYVRVIGRARAQVFAGCEDFGIALAEAQARGTPLVAFARGGARDIVRPLGGSEAPSGVLFAEQTVESLVAAIELFEAHAGEITPQACRASAMRFSVDAFTHGVMAGFEKAVALADRKTAVD